MGAWEDGFAAGYRAAAQEYEAVHGKRWMGERTPATRRVRATRARPKRKASAYSKRYGAAFKRLAKKNKKKNGGWKAGGFARTQKAAHKVAKRK